MIEDVLIEPASGLKSLVLGQSDESPWESFLLTKGRKGI
jgi:hypothetical protein